MADGFADRVANGYLAGSEPGFGARLAFHGTRPGRTPSCSVSRTETLNAFERRWRRLRTLPSQTRLVGGV